MYRKCQFRFFFPYSGITARYKYDKMTRYVKNKFSQCLIGTNYNIDDFFSAKYVNRSYVYQFKEESRPNFNIYMERTFFNILQRFLEQFNDDYFNYYFIYWHDDEINNHHSYIGTSKRYHNNSTFESAFDRLQDNFKIGYYDFDNDKQIDDIIPQNYTLPF